MRGSIAQRPVKSLEIPRWRRERGGSLKNQISNGKHEAKLEFLEGEGGGANLSTIRVARV